LVNFQDDLLKMVEAVNRAPSSLTAAQKAIATAASVTRTTGILHDVQVQHIQVWGALIFDFLPKKGGWEAHVDQNDRILIFKMMVKKRKPKNFAHRIQALEQAMDYLLTPGWLLQVYDQDNLIHEGERRKVREIVDKMGK
jgi:hypothetical protein